MTRTASGRILDLFEQALEMAAGARDAWLASLRQDDPAAAREIEALLAADEAAGDRMNTRVVRSGVSGSDDGWPVEIGPYRIEHMIGEGGMGRVLLASRIDADFEQKVAIKLIHPALANTDRVARFLEERRILARLRHPNIAQLIDAGVTEEGQPYFVMEYVEGIAVTDFIGTDMPLGDILRLFIRIGRAVQFAHGALVIHRDLKPGNILVTADGIPKLLDFGIAQAVGRRRDTDGVDRDGVSATPAYASPEQLTGKPLTVASDVYALGALLFEMVTGENAFRRDGMSAAELRSAVLETAPPSASTTGLGPARGVSRDLEAVLRMALEKAPENRYQTVNQFTDDVERILERRPVNARGRSWRYLAGHFATRHRWAIGASAAALAILVAGLVVTSLLYRDAQRAQLRAEQRFNDVRELAKAMLFDIYDEMAASPGSTQARALLGETAQRYLARLAADPDAPLEVRLEVGRGYRRLGDLFANPNMPGLARIEEGRAAYDRADAILARLAERNPGRDDIVYERAMLTLSRAQIAHHLDEDLDRARALSQRAEAMFASIGTESPLRRRAELGVLQARAERGILLNWSGQHRLAAPLFQQVDQGYVRLMAADPAEAEAIGRRRTQALRNLGDALYYAGDREGAVAAYRQAVPIYQRVLESEPRDVSALGDKVIIQWALGGALYDLGRHRESIRALEIAAETARLLQMLDPDDANARRRVTVVDSQRALTLSALRRFDEAIAVSLEGLSLRQAALREDPDTVGRHRDVAAAYRPLGDVYRAKGDRRRACDAYRESQRRWTELARRWNVERTEDGPIAEGIAAAC